MAETSVPRTQDTAGTLDQFDVFSLPDGKKQQAVALGDGVTQGRIAKVGVQRTLSVTTEKMRLSASSTTYSTAMTISLGVLSDNAGDSLPDLGSYRLVVINGTNQQINSSPALKFTDDPVAGLTPTGIAYSPYIDNIAAGNQGVQTGGLTNGYQRNVAVSVNFTTAPTTGTVAVVLELQGSGKAGTIVVDPQNGAALRVWGEGSSYSDGGPNHIVMGREYGGGGGNAYARSLHVDSDGCLLPVATRLVTSATAAVSTAVTATLAAPGAGYYNHVTSIQISKFVVTAQTANAAPLLATTSGLPGSLTFNLSNGALAIGVLEEKVLNFAQPIRASAANAAVSVTLPVQTGVIWRVNLFGYAA